MEVSIANSWARDLASYIRKRQPARNIALRTRIEAITHGEGLDRNDLDQLERKVRWILFGQPRIRQRRKERRQEAMQ